MSIIAMNNAMNNQSVKVNVTETGAKVPVYQLFGHTWDKPISAKDAIIDMGADFNVSKQHLIRVPQSVYEAIQNGEEVGSLNLSRANLISSHCATVRDDKDFTLGVVGSEYSVAQNVESLAFVDMLEEVSGHKINITSGGVLGMGETFFLQGKLDSSCFLGDGDEVEQYVTFSNGHSGKSALCVYMTPIRVVCQNSLMLSLHNANKVVFKHTKNLHTRLDWELEENRRKALEVFKRSVKFTKEFEDAMMNLKAKEVTKEDTLDFTARLYLNDAAYKLYLQNNRNWDGVEEISTRAKNQMDALLDSINNGIGQKGYYEGTALHLLNGLTTHQQNVMNWKDKETQFNSMIEGTENARLNKAYNLLMAA
jgi:hypothetical protein